VHAAADADRSQLMTRSRNDGISAIADKVYAARSRDETISWQCSAAETVLFVLTDGAIYFSIHLRSDSVIRTIYVLRGNIVAADSIPRSYT
jgi:hypothetical protein